MPRVPVVSDYHGVAHHIVKQGPGKCTADCGRVFGGSPTKRSVGRLKRKCTDCRWPPEDAKPWHPLLNLEDDV